ncbi:hypothetical protein LQ948_14050 [Jiella sp. MQZ9-1]|uniref:Uncharacterized protein n=1 Tax=Jiella flava TaxID=2816857 RepID=A0A939JXV4_9HYPH|nr:hypothetical protein [Jiella flava]MBO0663756.1 hypothetical protein [Jiella flava]MCD2472329.1 hypothetical protein [Jiella flava]
MSATNWQLRENLEYVGEMLEQLKIVSGVPQNDILYYFLDMAKVEVDSRLVRLSRHLTVANESPGVSQLVRLSRHFTVANESPGVSQEH